jgi:hypothetical protein
MVAGMLRYLRASVTELPRRLPVLRRENRASGGVFKGFR